MIVLAISGPAPVNTPLLAEFSMAVDETECYVLVLMPIPPLEEPHHR